MTLKRYRETRPKNLKDSSPVRVTLSSENLRLKLLYKRLLAAYVVEENKKRRIQFIEGVVLKIKKPRTEQLLTVYREAIRKIGTKRDFSFKTPTIGFIETRENMFI